MTSKEKTIESKVLYDGKILKLDLIDVELSDGKKSKREIVRHNGGCTILAKTQENKILLIKQYRKAFDEEVLELPAGKIEENEDPLECAKRELQEESGYLAKNIEKLGVILASPGYTSEKIHIFRATDLEYRPIDCDWDEHLEVFEMEEEEVNKLIKDGKITDGKTIAALHFNNIHGNR